MLSQNRSNLGIVQLLFHGIERCAMSITVNMPLPLELSSLAQYTLNRLEPVVCICESDLYGRISWGNDPFFSLCGDQAEDQLGETIWGAVRSLNVPELIFDLNAFIRDGTGAVSKRYNCPSSGTAQRFLQLDWQLKKDRTGYVCILVVAEALTETAIVKNVIALINAFSAGIGGRLEDILDHALTELSKTKSNIRNNKNSIENLNSAIKTIGRAKSLSGCLIGLGAPGQSPHDPIDARPYIESVVKKAVIHQSIDLSFSFGSSLRKLCINKVQVALLLNAIVKHLATSAKLLKIDCDNSDERPSEDNAAPLHGKYLRISIRYQGKKDMRRLFSHIFSPFLALKSGRDPCFHDITRAKATDILRHNRGHIQFESLYPNWGRINLFFKSVDKKGTVFDKDTNMEKRILVMDDEILIRDIIKSALEKRGYEVDSAPSGEEALRICEAASKDSRFFDLAILDLSVKDGLGGRDIIPHLKKINPSIKSLLISGFCTDLIFENFEKEGFSAFLPKPFKMEALLETVDRMVLPEPIGRGEEINQGAAF